ncbi:hypothetical protein THMIRHAM_03860 [Thiomicrorhabdus immobilis]|uniref:Uncharacterized protein n=1 Tax=Thiomicrorhabdus immobilis TaxID=2791037 RepID=A0ABM7MB85_9GAMM|nr:hypothetical protein [Thiomicrorhabdus immobilis]BCN92601.1 hypothetical protein THMIRHAM_03860 [Thiomicrorhabdus immobilis]
MNHPHEDDKLKKLLSIDEKNHSHKERTAMIIQGVHWLTLIQEMLILFIYKIPLACLSLLQTVSNQKESK